MTCSLCKQKSQNHQEVLQVELRAMRRKDMDLQTKLQLIAIHKNNYYTINILLLPMGEDLVTGLRPLVPGRLFDEFVGVVGFETGVVGLSPWENTTLIRWSNAIIIGNFRICTHFFRFDGRCTSARRRTTTARGPFQFRNLLSILPRTNLAICGTQWVLVCVIDYKILIAFLAITVL